jgi:gentisate 1,2-dioxygenase
MPQVSDGPEVSDQHYEQLETEDAIMLWDAVSQLVVDDRSAIEAQQWDGQRLIDLSQEIEEGITREEINQTMFETRAVVPDAKSVDGSILPTIFLGVQSFPAGDEATPHRHPHFAPRFVVDGHEGMRADVGGESFPATDYDLICTPSWQWHSHYNEGDETATWLSFLDLAFVLNGLGNTEEIHDPERGTGLKPDGYHNNSHGVLRPSLDGDTYSTTPPTDVSDRASLRKPTPTEPHRFAWEDVHTSLMSAAENGDGYDPYNGVCLEYVNPATGQPPISPTLSLRVQLLEEDEQTEAHKHNSLEAFFVVQGEGETEIGDEVFEWGKHDLFTIPAHTAHRHTAFDEETILFAASDAPILSAFNLHRELEVDDMNN